MLTLSDPKYGIGWTEPRSSIVNRVLMPELWILQATIFTSRVFVVPFTFSKFFEIVLFTLGLRHFNIKRSHCYGASLKKTPL